jgi:carbonyl reductase 1
MAGTANEGVAVVTGGNRGLGLETCRQLGNAGFHVILTARNAAKGQAAAAGLEKEGLSVEFRPLDVTEEESIASLARGLAADGVKLDVLVNNAALEFDGFDAEVARNTLAANAFGPIAVSDALVPLMPDVATIVMVSSGAGDLSAFAPALRKRFLDPHLTRDALTTLLNGFVAAVADDSYRADGWPGSAYKVSKAGLNAFTRILAAELASRRIKVNAVCPGWVRTDMGGPAAPRTIPKGAASIVWAARLGPDGPTGGFFRDGRPISW